MRKLVLAAVVLAIVGALVGGWLAFSSNVPASESGDPYSLRLPPGTDFDAAMDSLESAGAVRSPASLRLFAGLTGWGDQVKTGHYNVQPGMSNWALMNKVRKGLQDPIRITIPGGLTPERFARVLARQLGTDTTAVVQALADAALADSLGTDTAHLLGHMRANTYDILWTTDARRAVSRIHGWHDRFWTDENTARAKALGMTPDEVITLASIVEWEAQKASERPRIAGVYLNRLLGRTPAGKMRLQADPTVQFALMQAGAPSMRRLLFTDYQTPSAYNTYLIDGLPPGPLNNPSDDTIEAVLSGGERHGFLYFVADGSGGHDFSRTIAEHNAKAARWSAWLSDQIRQRRAREAGGGTSPAAAPVTP